jgi:alcohol dehydrogenase class IV
MTPSPTPQLFGALRLPATVLFGSGQRAAIGQMAAQIGKRALICTDARMSADAQFRPLSPTWRPMA